MSLRRGGLLREGGRENISEEKRHQVSMKILLFFEILILSYSFLWLFGTYRHVCFVLFTIIRSILACVVWVSKFRIFPGFYFLEQSLVFTGTICRLRRLYVFYADLPACNCYFPVVAMDLFFKLIIIRQ